MESELRDYVLMYWLRMNLWGLYAGFLGTVVILSDKVGLRGPILSYCIPLSFTPPRLYLEKEEKT